MVTAVVVKRLNAFSGKPRRELRPPDAARHTTAPERLGRLGARATRRRSRPRAELMKRLSPTLLLALLLVSGPCIAAFNATDTSWEGGSQLVQIARDELGARRVVTGDGLDWSSLKPADAVLVLHPTRALDPASASAFLRAGGRIAVLDDHGAGARFLARFDVHRMAAPERPAEALRERPALAIARPAKHFVGGSDRGRHPMVADVSELITNHPTGLRHPDLTPVLTIPAIGEPDVVLAVTGIIAGRGRLFAMGDPSAVMNQMLRYPGNRAFARGLIRYLLEDDGWGQRQGKLVIVANDFEQRGRYAGEGDLAAELRDQLAGFEDLVVDLHDDGLPPLLALLIGAIAGVAAAAWIASLTARVYQHYLPRYARPVPIVAQGGVAGHAAVLSAPTTTHGLALSELKSGLLDALGMATGLSPDLPLRQLVEAARQRDRLDAPGAQRLTQLVHELSGAEASIARGRSVRYPEADLRRLRAAAAELTETLLASPSRSR